MKNNSTTDQWPKTLLIRNTVGGMIWQVYHVNNVREALMLSDTATRNGYESCTLQEYDDGYKENWPEWRDLEGWKRRWASEERKEYEPLEGDYPPDLSYPE